MIKTLRQDEKVTKKFLALKRPGTGLPYKEITKIISSGIDCKNNFLPIRY